MGQAEPDPRTGEKFAGRHDSSDADESAALLSARKTSSLRTEVEVRSVEGALSRGSKPYIQELWLQFVMGAPLAGVTVLSSGTNLITTAEAGILIQMPLQLWPYLARLPVRLISGLWQAYWSFCKMPLMGMAGALDTLASQAVGAGRLDALPELFQRCFLFLSIHALPSFVTLVCMPRLYRAMGQAPEVCDNVAQIIPGMLVSLWLDVIYRPMNRTLVAQRITRPQLCVSAVCTALHGPLTFWFMMGVAGGSWAYSVTAFNQIWMLAAYILFTGRASVVWGLKPTAAALKGWGRFAKLAYAAGLMDCTESLTWGGTAILAGLLPNGPASTAAYSITIQSYSFFFMLFIAAMMVATTRVGNALGANDPWMARCSACCVLCAHPFFWGAGLIIILLPSTRRLVLATFTQGQDEVLEKHVRNLLNLAVVLLFPDGLQMMMAGIFQGMGWQKIGSYINIVGQLLVGLPCALILAFGLGLGVEGLVTGLMVGVVIQSCSYIVLLSRMDWAALAAAVAASQQPTKPPDQDPACV